MENTNGSTPLQADFLDLRHMLSEVAGSVFTLLLACFLTLFTFSRAAALYELYGEAGLYWSIPGALMTLLCLFACVVLWLLYAQGRKGFLKPGLIRAARALPIAEAVVAVMACLLMAAVLIVVLFSNSTVLASLHRIAASLSGGYFSVMARAATSLSALSIRAVTIVAVAAAVLMLFFTLRYCLLAGFLQRLSAMEKRNAAQRSPAGFVAILSLVMGALALATAAWMYPHPLPALCMLLYGATLFCAGLLLCKLKRELDFLYTYYAKLNRAAQRRAAGIKAQEEALKNAPLMLPSTEKTPEEVDDIPPAADAPAVIHAQAPDEAAAASPAEAVGEPSEDALAEPPAEAALDGDTVSDAEDAPQQSEAVDV
ncbi:MAG: hypothetical protein PHC80_08765 [Eubacteriales bacterium]|nr:hypothetical protein [Eubacteriales bacterium]